MSATTTPSSQALRWRRFGDIGILLELDGPEQVLRWSAAIDAAQLDLRARAGWCSILITSAMAPAAIVAALATLDVGHQPPSTPQCFEVPVRYDGDDLPAVAEATGMSAAEVVAIHTAAVYRVVFLGFSRGFAYLSGLDARLWLPRRATPRARVPKGSVAIAAGQTGIYPQDSPGGWHLLGHTTMEFFDEQREPPALARPGDEIRFVAK